MGSIKCYLNTDAVIQFDEADLLARMEWINSLNQDFGSAQTSLERLDFADWIFRFLENESMSQHLYYWFKMI